MKTDKKGWVLTSLGDVCVKKEELDREAASKRVQRFIRVEHLDADSLHIKRWGKVDEDELPPTFFKIFRKGQMLFPTRNPHLRRAALASFDGICGEKTLTLEPKLEIVTAEFFPFIFSSEAFTNHTTSAIIGSTNPHVRWRDVADFKFLLPPKDQQNQLAKLLWAGEEVGEKYDTQLKILNEIIQNSVEALIHKSNISKKEIKNIVVKELKGFVDGDWIESKDQSDAGVRLIQLADIGIREFINKSRRYISEETFTRLKCFEILEGDLLIARMPDPLGRACLFPDIGTKAITAVDVCILRVNEKEHNPKYWEYTFNSKTWFELMNVYASGTTRTRISKRNLESLTLPFPDKKKQDEIVKKLDLISNSITRTDEIISQQKQIQKQIINQIFSN